MMSEKKLNRLHNEVDIYNVIGEAINDCADDNNLTETEREQFSLEVWGSC